MQVVLKTSKITITNFKILKIFVQIHKLAQNKNHKKIKKWSDKNDNSLHLFNCNNGMYSKASYDWD